jgi:uncharacterized protein involved in exopolysaccharide biosynthesis
MLMKREDTYYAELAQRLETAPRSTAIFDPRKLWLIARWHARLIVLVTLAAAMLAAVALTLLPPGFRATAVVLIDPRQPRVTTSESVISGIGSDAAAVESQVELIESSALASKVISRLGLNKDPDFTGPTLIERVLALVGRPWPAERATNELVYRFQQGLSVRRRGLTYVLEISYNSKNPEKAARIANAIADAYLSDQTTAKAEVTSRASSWLSERIDEMRDKVREADRAVAEYRVKTGLTDVTQGNRLINKQIEDLTQQLTLARSRMAEARAKLNQVETAKKNGGLGLSEVLESKVIANLRTEYTQASRAVSENALLLGERHPALAAARAQLASVQRQLDNEVSRILESVRNNYEVASRQVATLDTQLTKLKDESADLRRTDVKLHELEREAQVNRTLLEQYLSRSKETDQQQSLHIAEARIISPALVPVKSNRPPMPVLISAAGATGLIAAFGLMLLLEQSRRTFRSSDDIRDAIGLKTLNILPALGRKAGYEYILSKDASDYASRVRSVLLRLRHLQLDDTPQTLGIVSALPNEGKSTFASNLAIASAMSGERTLLIDADPYNPSVSEYFGTDRSPLKNRGSRLLDQLSPISHQSGLHIAHLGQQTARDLVDQNGLSTFFAACHKTYDRIIIDLPAVLPTGGSPALFDAIEHLLFVIKWDATTQQDVTDALDAIRPNSRKVVGALLNEVPARWEALAGAHGMEYEAYWAQQGRGGMRARSTFGAPAPAARR